MTSSPRRVRRTRRSSCTRPSTGSRVTRPRCWTVPLSPKTICDDVDRRAEVVGDVVRASVHLGARRRRTKTARTARGMGSSARRRANGWLCPLVDSSRTCRRAPEVVGGEVGVLLDAAVVFECRERRPNRCRSIPSTTSAEHLDQPPVRVVGEPRVAGAGASRSSASSFRPRLRIVSIIPASRSRRPTARRRAAGRRSSRSACRSSARGGATRSSISSAEPVRQLVRGHERVAGVGRDREAGRHRHAHRRHLGEPDPLAAEQLAPARRVGVEVVDVGVRHEAGAYRRRARELGDPGQGTQAEPERGEQPVEEDERGPERRVPDGPAPLRRPVASVSCVPVASRRSWTTRMIRCEISSIESSLTSITGQPSRRWMRCAYSSSS